MDVLTLHVNKSAAAQNDIEPELLFVATLSHGDTVAHIRGKVVAPVAVIVKGQKAKNKYR